MFGQRFKFLARLPIELDDPMSYDTVNLNAALRADPAMLRGPAPSAPAARTEKAPPAVTVDTLPSAPPPEVLHEIAAASQAYDRLAAAGHHLQFGTDPATGRLAVDVIDASGRVSGQMSATAALRVATTGRLA